jgi:predicted SAM-dependent methyltransferase
MERVMGIKLEIGCGGNPKEGYIHLDTRALPHVEIVADAFHIPLKDESCSEILTVHVIEHFWWTQMDTLLKEWYRVMEVGGKIITRTPDLDGCIEAWSDGSWKEEVGRPGHKFPHDTDTDRNMWLNHKLHGTAATYNAHLTNFNFELLKTKLERAGFKEVTRFGSDRFTLSVTAIK